MRKPEGNTKPDAKGTEIKASISHGEPYEVEWAEFKIPTSNISLSVDESNRKYIRLHTKQGKLRLSLRITVVIPGHGVMTGMAFLIPAKGSRTEDRIIEL